MKLRRLWPIVKEKFKSLKIKLMLKSNFKSNTMMKLKWFRNRALKLRGKLTIPIQPNKQELTIIRCRTKHSKENKLKFLKTDWIRQIKGLMI